MIAKPPEQALPSCKHRINTAIMEGRNRNAP